MLQTLFWLFQCSKNPRWNVSNLNKICRGQLPSGSAISDSTKVCDRTECLIECLQSRGFLLYYFESFLSNPPWNVFLTIKQTTVNYFQGKFLPQVLFDKCQSKKLHFTNISEKMSISFPKSFFQVYVSSEHFICLIHSKIICPYIQFLKLPLLLSFGNSTTRRHINAHSVTQQRAPWLEKLLLN